LGVLLAVVGLAISASAYGRWAGNERAMRNDAPLPHSPLMVAVSAVLAVVAVIVVAVVIFG
jgi:putative membrane protein